MKTTYVVTLAAVAIVFSTTYLASKSSRSDQKLLNNPAPLFTAQTLYPDGTIGEFNLSKHLGQNIVLYFYPKDNSPCCTTQAKKFRDDIKMMKDKNILLVGISSDSIKSHQNFQHKLSLPYPLISDAQNDHAISKMYKTNGFLFGKRKTFLINKQGIIFKIFDKIDIENQVTDILNCFKAIA